MPDSRAKPNTRRTQSIRNRMLQPRKRPPTNKQHVIRVKLDEIPPGVLPPSLLRDVHHRAFHEFEQGLLHAFAGDVAGDADVLAFAAYLEGRREGVSEERGREGEFLRIVFSTL